MGYHVITQGDGHKDLYANFEKTLHCELHCDVDGHDYLKINTKPE